MTRGAVGAYAFIFNQYDGLQHGANPDLFTYGVTPLFSGWMDPGYGLGGANPVGTWRLMSFSSSYIDPPSGATFDLVQRIA